MAQDTPAELTWNVCRPLGGGIAWQEPHVGATVVVAGTVVGTVVAGTVVETVVGDVVGTVVGAVVVVAGTVVKIVVGCIVVVGCTVVVNAPGSGFGLPTFQLRLETSKLTNPVGLTEKIPISV